MIDYREIIKNRETRLKIIRLLSFIPTEPYLKMVYRIKTGMKLNLKNPRGFNEKQNWLKIHDIHPEYTDLVDKYKVREYIERTLGKEYLIPLLGVWEKFDDIPFNDLPEKFVLKCNHDSGSVKLILDKDDINLNELKKFYDFRMKLNPYCLAREYPYKNVKPLIIAEKYMGTEIKDYKFYCFSGKPKIVFTVSDRFNDCRMDYFDMNFDPIDLKDGESKQSENKVVMSKNFEKMKKFAEILSENKKFVRVDFYDVKGELYFGELTFFNGGGFDIAEPIEWENKLGDLINLD